MPEPSDSYHRLINARDRLRLMGYPLLANAVGLMAANYPHDIDARLRLAREAERIAAKVETSS